jgi:hypothetical protein
MSKQREESLTETVLGVSLIVGLFCLFFTYTGQSILKQLLTIII